MTNLNEASLMPWSLQSFSEQIKSFRGILIALTIVGLWGINLAFLFSLDLSQVQTVWVIPAIAVQTFLYTGLFITAHDAMHGSLFPQNHRINHWMGTVIVLLYALFPYRKLLKNHWAHHLHPASEADPDFHNGRHKNIVAWYGRFITRYCSLPQIIGLSTIFHLLRLTSVAPEENLILFWLIPSLLSSLQLFYFGIFLPHREPAGGYSNGHRAQSNSLPPFWSFITCYHFGYHEEHHESPVVPWWQLPAIRKQQGPDQPRQAPVQ